MGANTSWIRGTSRAHSLYKKCDAKQPCTTCGNKNRGAACKYESSRSNGGISSAPQTSPPIDVLLPWFDFREPGPPNPLSVGSRKRSLAPPEQLEEPLPLVLEIAAPDPSLEGSAPQNTLGVTERPPSSTVSSFKLLPSIHFQTIPRPLHIPLSLIPPERVQVSWVTGSDLDMTLYVLTF